MTFNKKAAPPHQVCGFLPTTSNDLLLDELISLGGVPIGYHKEIKARV